jgi:hypothetical protein
MPPTAGLATFGRGAAPRPEVNWCISGSSQQVLSRTERRASQMRADLTGRIPLVPESGRD